ncbi:MAG: DUF5104 domain-containing protein [Oscillospiraceae bacterium]|nr:DUF5104 domain-containing protein [Oscillospiraceae bacterium]
MKLLIMIFSVIVGFFSLILSPFLSERPERTDWMDENGVYEGFFYENNAAEKTMNRLLELSEAGDVGYLYKTFSQNKQKEFPDQLEVKIPELMDFLSSRVTDWEAAYNSYSRNNGTVSRYIDYNLFTEDGTYSMEFSDVMIDGQGSGPDEGFKKIYIWPEDFGNRSLRHCLTDAAIRIVYQTDETEIMEQFMELAETENAAGLLELFSQEVRENTEGLSEKTGELFDFLNNAVISWELYAHTQSIGTHYNGKTAEDELFFILYTEDVPYLCTACTVTEDTCHSAALGLRTIAVLPLPPSDLEVVYNNPWYEDYCEESCEAAGIFTAYPPES